MMMGYEVRLLGVAWADTIEASYMFSRQAHESGQLTLNGMGDYQENLGRLDMEQAARTEGTVCKTNFIIRNECQVRALFAADTHAEREGVELLAEDVPYRVWGAAVHSGEMRFLA